jgi:alkaline phosphatase D
LVSTSLPPEPFEPVGVEFITGSISAPGLAESAEHNVPRDHPLRALYLYDDADGRVHSATNVSLLHGVRTSLALSRTGDVRQALAERNADVAPHLAFADVGGHGYTVIRADADAVEAELVCIPRPVERSPRPDGGPLAYRVAFRAPRWTATTPPRLERTRAEGTLPIGT